MFSFLEGTTGLGFQSSSALSVALDWSVFTEPVLIATDADSMQNGALVTPEATLSFVWVDENVCVKDYWSVPRRLDVSNSLFNIALSVFLYAKYLFISDA